MQLSWNRQVEYILIVHHKVHLFEVLWVIEESRPIPKLSLLDRVKLPILPRRLRNRALVEAQDVDEISSHNFVLLVEHVDDAVGLAHAVERAHWLL